MYDITSISSFNNIDKWLRNILQHSHADIEKVILGNKCDLEKCRRVPREQGEAIAKEKGIPFLETSAKTNINIEEAFLNISKRILNKITATTPTFSSQPTPLSEHVTTKPTIRCCMK